jgi:hypothetical protein
VYGLAAGRERLDGDALALDLEFGKALGRGAAGQGILDEHPGNGQ